MRGSEDHDGIRREIEDLNGHFLNLTAAATFGAPAFGLTPDLLDRLRNLAPERTARLANCPFALFELSTAVNAEKTNPPGLLHRLREGPEPADSVVRFTLLALIYQRQLVHINPRAACLRFGLTFEQRQRLIDMPLSGLADIAAARSDVLKFRFAGQGRFWTDLIGLAAEGTARQLAAAHLSGLQRVVTGLILADPRP